VCFNVAGSRVIWLAKITLLFYSYLGSYLLNTWSYLSDLGSYLLNIESYLLNTGNYHQNGTFGLVSYQW